MKNTALTTLAALALAATAVAQVPDTIAYQAFLSEDDGSPYAASVDAPKNVEVQFRIYDSASGGAVQWAESQTVSVFQGNFSTQLGLGDEITGEPNPMLSDSFTDSERFLEITTIDSGTTKTFAPRQRLVSAPFAFRAKLAENATTVVDGAIGSSQLASGAVNTSHIASAAVTGDQIAANAINGARIADGSITGGDIADGSIGTSDLAPSARSPWTVSGQDVSRTSGTVSILGAGLGNPADGPAGSSGTKLVLYPGNGTTTPYALGINGGTLWYGAAQNAQHIWYSGTTEKMRLAASGHLGIGTSTPDVPIDIDQSSNLSYPIESRWTQGGGQVLGGVPDPFPIPFPVSVRASGVILAGEFHVQSDARIKNVTGISNRSADLETVSRIEISDYTHIDVAAKGSAPQKKVIAQQIAKIYPSAVSTSSGVVPDIYQRAAMVDGWVHLATDLEVGEKVKLIRENGSATQEVLEVRDGAFRVAPEADEEIFVYGRQVDDFHTVDYDALSMLNISATQEIYRQLQSEQTKNAQLEQRLAKLEALVEGSAVVRPVVAR